MSQKPMICHVDDVEGKIAHGGAARIRILIDDIRCGAKNFSLLVNTMKAGLNCNVTGLGHSHAEEHCMFGLSGKGGIAIDGVKHDIGPNMVVFIPSGAMHYMWAGKEEDFTYIIVYSPPGPEKAL